MCGRDENSTKALLIRTWQISDWSFYHTKDLKFEYPEKNPLFSATIPAIQSSSETSIRLTIISCEDNYMCANVSIAILNNSQSITDKITPVQIMLVDSRGNKLPTPISKDCTIPINFRNVFIDDVCQIKFTVYLKNQILQPSPPIKRSLSGIGITRSGRTCYINVILQMLYHLTPISRLILSSRPQSSQLLRILQSILICLYKEQEVTNHVDHLANFFSLCTQSDGDAHTFYESLLNELTEAEETKELAAAIKDLSNFSIEETKEYFTSPKVFEKQKISFICLNISEATTFESAMEIETAKIQMKSAFGTEIGYKKVSYKPPFPTFCQVLLCWPPPDQIHSPHFKVEDSIDLAKFADGTTNNGCSRYSLVGAIVYLSIESSGHYLFYFRQSRSSKWVEFNDSNVEESTQFFMNPQYRPAILVYIRDDLFDSKLTPLTAEDILYCSTANPLNTQVDLTFRNISEYFTDFMSSTQSKIVVNSNTTFSELYRIAADKLNLNSFNLWTPSSDQFRVIHVPRNSSIHIVSKDLPKNLIFYEISDEDPNEITDKSPTFLFYFDTDIHFIRKEYFRKGESQGIQRWIQSRGYAPAIFHAYSSSGKVMDDSCKSFAFCFVIIYKEIKNRICRNSIVLNNGESIHFLPCIPGNPQASVVQQYIEYGQKAVLIHFYEFGPHPRFLYHLNVPQNFNLKVIERIEGKDICFFEMPLFPPLKQTSDLSVKMEKKGDIGAFCYSLSEEKGDNSLIICVSLDSIRRSSLYIVRLGKDTSIREIETIVEMAKGILPPADKRRYRAFSGYNRELEVNDVVPSGTSLLRIETVISQERTMKLAIGTLTVKGNPFPINETVLLPIDEQETIESIRKKAETLLDLKRIKNYESFTWFFTDENMNRIEFKPDQLVYECMDAHESRLCLWLIPSPDASLNIL